MFLDFDFGQTTFHKYENIHLNTPDANAALDTCDVIPAGAADIYNVPAKPLPAASRTPVEPTHTYCHTVCNNLSNDTF